MALFNWLFFLAAGTFGAGFSLFLYDVTTSRDKRYFRAVACLLFASVVSYSASTYGETVAFARAPTSVYTVRAIDGGNAVVQNQAGTRHRVPVDELTLVGDTIEIACVSGAGCRVAER